MKVAGLERKQNDSIGEEGKRPRLQDGWWLCRGHLQGWDKPTLNHRKPQESMVNDEPEAFHHIVTSVKMGQRMHKMTRLTFPSDLGAPHVNGGFGVDLGNVCALVDWWSSFAAVVVQWTCS